MISVKIFIIICIPLFTLARFIKEPETTEEHIVWYPTKKTIAPISPEFSWIYLQHNNNKIDLTTLTRNTEEFFLFSPYRSEDLINLTSFYLYTEKNKNKTQTLLLDDLNSLKNSNWDPSKYTRIIIHGFDTDSKDEYILRMKDRFLDLNEANNVILFDWGPLAKLIYPSAASITDKVGEICAWFIDFLCTHGGHPSRFHLIGHSLGAHVAGFAGKFTTYGLIARITGLDPAYPGFITEGKDGRLDAGDAEFVDCIHTCGGLIAFEKPICHADYYPNGGANPQPGCTGFFESTGCSHSRSHDLFIESIIKGHKFPALTCKNIPDDISVKCVNQGALMGFPAQSKYKGIFYTKTNSQFPYAPLNPKKLLKYF